MPGVRFPVLGVDRQHVALPRAADRRMRSSQRPEQAGEGLLAGGVEEVLVAEEDDLALEQRLADARDGVRIEVAAKTHALDPGTDVRAQLVRGDCGRCCGRGHRDPSQRSARAPNARHLTALWKWYPYCGIPGVSPGVVSPRRRSR